MAKRDIGKQTGKNTGKWVNGIDILLQQQQRPAIRFHCVVCHMQFNGIRITRKLYNGFRLLGPLPLPFFLVWISACTKKTIQFECDEYHNDANTVSFGSFSYARGVRIFSFHFFSYFPCFYTWFSIWFVPSFRWHLRCCRFFSLFCLSFRL